MVDVQQSDVFEWWQQGVRIWVSQFLSSMAARNCTLSITKLYLDQSGCKQKMRQISEGCEV